MTTQGPLETRSSFQDAPYWGLREGERERERERERASDRESERERGAYMYICIWDDAEKSGIVKGIHAARLGAQDGRLFVRWLLHVLYLQISNDKDSVDG